MASRYVGHEASLLAAGADEPGPKVTPPGGTVSAGARPDRWSAVAGIRAGGSPVAVITYDVGTIPVQPDSPLDAPGRDPWSRTPLTAVAGRPTAAVVDQAGDGPPT